MDAELQSLRRKGPATIARLQERAAKLMNGDKETSGATGDRNGDHVRVRLAEVMTIYGEVDRAAKRLEYLTEQRRECLREMTRQRALEDEINDVSREWDSPNLLFNTMKYLILNSPNAGLARRLAELHERVSIYCVHKLPISRNIS